MRDTRAMVQRFLAGHRAAEARQRQLVEARGPMPEQAVQECLDVLAALERLGTWPGPRDAVQERDVQRVRRLWAKVKRGYQSAAKG